MTNNRQPKTQKNEANLGQISAISDFYGFEFVQNKAKSCILGFLVICQNKPNPDYQTMKKRNEAKLNKGLISGGTFKDVPSLSSEHPCGWLLPNEPKMWTKRPRFVSFPSATGGFLNFDF